jgi:hypothetical protein
MVQEICFIEVDECCWNSALDILEAADYFEILTKIQNENSRTLTTKLVDVFLRFPTNICVSHADKPSNG